MHEDDLTLAFCINMWSHYQLPICNELVRLLGENRYKLCLFEQVHEERRQLGWASDIPQHRWIVGPPGSVDDLGRLYQSVYDADVAVSGELSTRVAGGAGRHGQAYVHDVRASVEEAICLVANAQSPVCPRSQTLQESCQPSQRALPTDGGLGRRC